MSTFQRYLSKLFISRWLLIAFGLTALVLILDLMANGEDIIESGGAGLNAVFRYMYLRFPIIFVRIFPFSLLLAILLTLIQLTQRGELVAMMAAGVSQFQLLVALLPVAMTLAALQFVVGDQLSPRAVAALKAWGVGDYGHKRDGTALNPIWVREGSQIIRIGSTRRHGELLDVTIFRRHPDGSLAEKLSARRAVYFDKTAWQLEDVRRYEIDRMTETRVPDMEWRVSLKPGLVLALAAHPRDLDLGALTKFSRQRDLGSRPAYVYEVWRQKRLAQPVVIIALLLLCVPLVQRFQRQGRAALIVFAGVLGGFLFFTLDALLLTIGEAGFLPPVLAAWSSTTIVALIGLWMAVHREFLSVS